MFSLYASYQIIVHLQVFKKEKYIGKEAEAFFFYLSCRFCGSLTYSGEVWEVSLDMFVREMPAFFVL